MALPTLVSSFELRDSFSGKAQQAITTAERFVKALKDIEREEAKLARQGVAGDAKSGRTVKPPPVIAPPVVKPPVQRANFIDGLFGKAQQLERFAQGTLLEPFAQGLTGLVGKGVQASVTIGKLGTVMGSVFGPAGAAAAGPVVLGALGVALSGVMFVAGGTAGAIAGLLPQLTQLAGFGFQALGTAMAMPFINASAEIDSAQRMFGAFLGNMEKGKQAMQFVRDYGLKSAFKQEPLIEATRTLYAGQLDPNRYLPVMEKIALLKGRPKDENLQDISSVVRQIIGGQITEGFGSEGVGRFGINKKMLEEYGGAKFDSKGGFVGGLNEALEVLEKLSQKSPILKDIKQVMESSDETRISNAWDAVNFAIVGAGNALKLRFLPFIESAAGAIKALTENGTVARIAAAWADLFGMGGDGASPVFLIAAWLEEIPTLIGNVKDMGLALFEGMQQGIQNLNDIMFGPVNLLVKAINGLLDMASQLPMVGEKVPKARLPLIDVGSVALPWAAAGFDMGKGFFGGAADRVAARAKLYEEQAKKHKPTDPTTAPLPEGSPDSGGEKDQAKSFATSLQEIYLKQIADNTAKMAEMRDVILGGGTKGTHGLNAKDLGSVKGGSRAERQVQQGIQLLMDGMNGIALDQMLSAREAGF